MANINSKYRKMIIITIPLILFILILGIYFFFNVQIKGAPGFTGIVQSDGCLVKNVPIGDVGCSITVNNMNVTIVHGNIYTPSWGNLYGFNPGDNIIGKKVEVKAHKFSDGYALSDSSDFVKLLN